MPDAAPRPDGPKPASRTFARRRALASREFSLSRMKSACRARDITEAEIIRGLLLSNQIEALVSGYSPHGWGYGRGQALLFTVDTSSYVNPEA